jgi:uncharacterized protein YxeA
MIIIIIIIIILLLLLLETAIGLSLGGSSPYTSTDKKTKKYIHQRNNTKTQYKQYNTQQYKYTYYQNTHKTQTYTHTHTHKLLKKYVKRNVTKMFNEAAYSLFCYFVRK